MRKHTLNLYKINNLSELDFSYKLIEFQLPQIEGKEDLFNKQLQKLLLKVSSITEGPAAIINRNNNIFIAIPSDKTFEETRVDVTPFSVSLKLLPDIYHLGSHINVENMDIVLKFLDFEIRKQLLNNKSIWKLNSNHFFLKKPVFSNEESNIEFFGGFTYKLIPLPDGGIYLCLDLTFKYVDKNFVSQYVNEKNVETIGKRFRGKKLLYQNGNSWYTVEIVAFGEKIKDHNFTSPEGTQTVMNYILSKPQKYPKSTTSLINPDDLTLLYKYPGRSMEPHHGASSLGRILYSTKDSEVKALHKFSIKEPSKRFHNINKCISEYFQHFKFNGKNIIINKNPIVEQINNFRIPILKYNKSKLQIGNFGANIPINEFAFKRKQFLLENGVINQSSFDEQLLIVPDYLDKELVEAFKKNAEWQIKKLSPAFPEFKVIRYKSLSNQAATYQIQEIEKVLQKHNALSGFALFILPDLAYDSKKYIKNFHDCLKSKFYPELKVQCASASKIKSFFQSYTTSNSEKSLYEYKVPENKKPGFRSYLFNLVLEHLLVNRKWPFALENNLNYDIYIGIDVHDRFAGFSFFFKNGEKIFFFPIQVPKKNKSQRAEKLKAGLLYDMIYDKLKLFIPQYAINPNGIVIIRDGRSYGEEVKALAKVIDNLGQEGIVNKNTLKVGVIDLHKQSAIPLRVASQTNGHHNHENPITGAYKLINSTEGFLFNTGYPFEIRGTAKPLHLSLQYGDIDFLKAMEDIFCQTILAFSAPDRSNSLPITIKLIDTLLEPLTATGVFEEEDEEEQEFEEIEESITTTN